MMTTTERAAWINDLNATAIKKFRTADHWAAKGDAALADNFRQQATDRAIEANNQRNTLARQLAAKPATLRTADMPRGQCYRGDEIDVVLELVAAGAVEVA